jgi:hypothetical protein
VTPGAIYTALKAALATEGIPFDERPEHDYLAFALGQDDDWLGIAQALEPEGQAIVFAIWPVPLPQERMWEAAALVARLNENVTLGTYELRIDDGELRIRAAIDFAGLEPDARLLRPLLMACQGLSHRAEPAVRAMQAGAPLDDALAAVVG